MRMPFATKAQTKYRRWAGVMASWETESRKEEEEEAEEAMAKRMNEEVGGCGRAGCFLTRSRGAGGEAETEMSRTRTGWKKKQRTEEENGERKREGSAAQ
jgi:hypothetical protein